MSAVKLICMGVGGVGKSALTVRFCDGTWVERVRQPCRRFPAW